jgi:hypothetical protein
MTRSSTVNADDPIVTYAGHVASRLGSPPRGVQRRLASDPRLAERFGALVENACAARHPAGPVPAAVDERVARLLLGCVIEPR